MKQFELVQAQRPKRSAFDLSHERKTTMNMGELIPVMCTEVLPGDRFKIDFESFLRTMPLISPVMHRVNMYAHAFFVPNRLLMQAGKWEGFITNKTADVIPWINANAFAANYKPVAGDLLDHLGYGVWIGAGTAANAIMSQLPLRAYHKIWNDHYRDQNQQAEYDFLSLPDQIQNNVDYTTFYSVRKRAWEKDYFTSALPSPQRGNDVTLPLGSYAPVQSKRQRTGNAADTVLWRKVVDLGPPAVGGVSTLADGELAAGAAGLVPTTGLEADLTNATGSSISALRRAFALQRWYEASMRFGQRYVEQLLGLFGVVSKDARLQRAEFIGGGKLPVQIGEVLQTSGTAAGSTPQGNMAGRAVSAGSLMHIDKTFDEHGYIMIIVSVVPRTSYSTIALRQNFKVNLFDFAFPQLAHLSEQPVYKAELYNTQDDFNGRLPWGYQPVYSEYRYIPDSVHGNFRDTLGFWSISRDFAALPALNASFVQCSPRTDIFPVAFANQQLLLQTFAKVVAIRPLPKFGTPL